MRPGRYRGLTAFASLSMAVSEEDLHVKFVMGVGGSFDVVAGKVERAPEMDAEGRYGMVVPAVRARQMWRRYLYTNSLFL